MGQIIPGLGATAGLLATIAAVFPDDWTHRAPIVIQSDRVNADNAVVNFPVYLPAGCIPEDFLDSNLFPVAGGDIRFSSDLEGEVLLPCEVVSFTGNATPGSATCEIWVKLPTVSPTNNTTFYMWRKSDGGVTQPNTANPIGRNEVWADYLGVWHGDDLTDATGNGNDLTAFGGATVGSATAKIGKAFSLSRASEQYLSAGSASMLDNLMELTVQCWARNTLTDSKDAAIISKSPIVGNLPWVLWDEDQYGLGFFAPGGNRNQTSDGELPQNSWNLVAGQAGPVLDFFWVNGEGASFSHEEVPQADQDFNLQFGYSSGGSNGQGSGAALGYYNGQIDEVRISNIQFDGDWMAVDYETQADPVLFAIPGTVIEL